MSNSSPLPLPLARLLVVGMLVPAVFSGLDHWLLSQIELRPSHTPLIVLTMAAYVGQIGLLGVLCGGLLVNPWWRWGLYVWGWVLVDLQLLSATVFVDGGNWWSGGRLLPGSLFSAQVGLTIIWAFLGSTRWAIRLPVCAVVGLLLAVPLQSGYGFTIELFPVQMIALAGLCLVLRWQRFRLQRIVPLGEAAATPGSAAARQLQQMQFSIRHVLIWTTSLAVVLGVLRALDLLSLRALAPYFQYGFVSLATSGLVVSCVLIVALWAALGAGPAWVRLPLLAIVLPSLGLVLAALSGYSDFVRFSGIYGVGPGSNYSFSTWLWREFWDQDSWLVAWVALAGGLLFASLLILRVIGFRLVRTTKPRPVVGVIGA